MTKSCLVWTAAFSMVALACLLDFTVRAADAPENEALKKHGLKVAGSLAVAIEESEVKTKLVDARRLSKQLSHSLMQQQGTMSPADREKTVKTLGTQINQLRSEMNAVNQQMSRVPRNNSRFGRYGGGMNFVNNEAAEMYEELLAYRNQVQAEINQDSYSLNQLKSQPADPKAKERIDSEVRDRRDAYHQALLDLRKLVDSANAKYETLTKDGELKKTLRLLEKGKGKRSSLARHTSFRLTSSCSRNSRKPNRVLKRNQLTARRRGGAVTARAKQSSKGADASGDSDGSP